jgi:hypothetical protein
LGWNTKPNIKAKTIKLLEENVRGFLYNPGVDKGKDFLGQKSAQAKKMIK